MGLVLGILGWVIAALVLVIVVVLITPLRLELAVQKDARWQVSAALRPFGRLGPRIVMSGRKKTPKAVKKKRKKPGGVRHPMQARPRRIIGAVVRLVSDILSSVRINSLDVDARFGLGDPAETGQAYGAICPVIFGTAHARHLRFQVEPVFDHAMLAGRADLVLSLIPGALLYPLIRFVWHVFGPARFGPAR